MYEKRKTFLEKLIVEEGLVGLEIGALDRPLLGQNETSDKKNNFFLDHLSTEGLKQKYKDDPSVDIAKIVGVDFIDNSGNLSEAVCGSKFDYIVASHVFEHVPNPIAWMQMVFAALQPGGFLFLVLPDKRFTFDYQRPVTTFGMMLQSYLQEKSKPSAADVYDHYASAVMVDTAKVWSGVLCDADLIPLTPASDALRIAKEVHKSQRYQDVHVSIFTPASFLTILEHLIKSGLLRVQVSCFKNTDLNDIEFFVCLKKVASEETEPQEKLLASIPRLDIENFTAPYMPQVKMLSDALKNMSEVTKKLQTDINHRDTIIHSNNLEIASFKDKLSFCEQTLGRRSVRFVLFAIDVICKLLAFRSR